MKQLLRIWFAGLTISFLGSLPLETRTVAASNIVVTDGMAVASLCSMASVAARVTQI